MKQIPIEPIPSIEKGRNIQVPELKDGEFVLDEKGKVKSRDATIVDILNNLIVSFPARKLTMENITEGVRLKEQLTNAPADGTLALEDSTHAWVIKMLKDNEVGVKMLAFNLPNVLKVVERE